MNVVLILSGGMDSAVLLHELRAEHQVHCIGFDYGQRHRRELRCARDLCTRLDTPFNVVDLSAIGNLLPGSSQTDPNVPVPDGRYDEPSMKQTVVPNRNMLMLAAAGAIAVARDCDAVAFGAHSGDHAIYPDCRSEFVVAMEKAFAVANWSGLRVLAPFLFMDKGQIAKRGVELGVPFELTWTCYRGEAAPCGKCGACVERAEAFEFAGVPDPLLDQPC